MWPKATPVTHAPGKLAAVNVAGEVDLSVLQGEPPLIRRLRDYCHHEGWTLDECRTLPAQYTVEFCFTCPGGYEHGYVVSYQMLAVATDPDEVAYPLFQAVAKDCAAKHQLKPSNLPMLPCTVSDSAAQDPQDGPGFGYADLLKEIEKIASGALGEPVTVAAKEFSLAVPADYLGAAADLQSIVNEQMKNLLLYGSTAAWPAKPAPPSASGAAVVRQLSEVVPALENHTVTCPAPGFNCPPGVPSTLAGMIIHLNDRHQWSRERIADWLDTLPIDLTLQPASTGD